MGPALARALAPSVARAAPPAPPSSRRRRRFRRSYKEISSIVLAPDFPGWFAPLSLSPGRLWEFLSFAATTSAAWALAAALTGGLSYRASRGVPDALRAACWCAPRTDAARQLGRGLSGQRAGLRRGPRPSPLSRP